ncbi:MAG: MBL fold metallo-hydrolase [Acidobacteria bacterium RIFCSPLOWO2_12_FULL_59_11]|nr:MAG: MBL fold metallo-hydrolase [Acidobacteria bacterium RIFCSPLOWO2_12_FULL_59_11]
MIHEILPVGLLQCNCSIVGDENSREAIVVDPGDEIEQILAILDRHALRVQYIVITHAHIDHIGGAKKLKEQTGAPVYMKEQDLELYRHMDQQALWLGVPPPETTTIDVLVRDGDEIRWGELQATVLHTPGHTQGSICLLFPQCAPTKLLAGDTLFRDSIGRTDLPGGNYSQILKSVKEKLLVLDDATIVFPGHGPVTTIGREREWNPFLQS